jgi:type I restriction enzyme M protein
MFLQHMLAVTRDGGMVATVMPHGVLFRGGEERAIRAGIIEADLLEAVIGIAPNLFYGTGIPACILVLRQQVQNGANRVSGKAAERQGKVLFINADAEYREGRAQNDLEPEHIEKIVSTYQSNAAIPGFASVVAKEELEANDWNLNIRRYADNAPPPEPQDVRAHLLGGVPKAEVAAHAELFAVHGFNPVVLLVERDERYFDFRPDLNSKAELKASVEADGGVRAREQPLAGAFRSWWEAHQGQIQALPETKALMNLRAHLLASFVDALAPLALLDRFQVAGAVATWWGEVVFDLKALVAGGFAGVVESWVTTILTALEEGGGKGTPLDHKLVKKLLPQFLDEIAEAESRVAELDGTIKAVTTGTEDEDGGGEADEAEGLSEAEIKALKKDLSAAKTRLKALIRGFEDRLEEAQAELSPEQAEQLVLAILWDDLQQELERRVAAHRQQVVTVVVNWWEKYRVTLVEIEGERDVSKERLDGFFREMGYAG